MMIRFVQLNLCYSKSVKETKKFITCFAYLSIREEECMV